MTESDVAGGLKVRRTFLRWLTGGFLSLWGLGAAAVGLSFLRSPYTAGRSDAGLVHCGSFSSLSVGSARFVRHGKNPLFVVRVSATEVIALSAICTHMHCILQWNDARKNILCPCHDGVFDRNGNVLSGPPSHPLPRFRAEVRADDIIVRTEGA